MSVGGEHLSLGQADIDMGLEDEVDAAGERHRALASPQALAGEVDRHQRRGAGGINDDARAFQIEHEGQASRRGESASPHCRVEIQTRPVPEHDVLVVVVAHADEDAGCGAGHLIEGVAGVLKGIAGLLQQKPLLGVHLYRLTWRDPEEGRIKGVDVFQEAAAAGVHRAG